MCLGDCVVHCLKSIIGDSVVISDEIVEVTNLFQQKLFQKIFCNKF